MAEITGNIRSLLGEVKVLRASGEEALLKEGDQIFAGDTIVTGAEGSAYIEFPATDGKTPTEGILQSNSTAKLTQNDSGALLDVTEGEFELLSEGNNQSVAVSGGGMAGLVGAGLLSGNIAGAIAAAAGAAFLLSDDNDSEGGATAPSDVPASIETIAGVTGPLAPTVTEAYGDLSAVTVVTDDTLNAVSPVTTSVEPIIDELAPVVDALAPALEPTNEATFATVEGLSPVTESLQNNVQPTTEGLTDALAPVTDVLLDNEDGQLSAAADTLPLNVRVLSENIAAGLDQAAPPIADGLNQLVTALEPVLGPLNDGVQQFADAATPLFDGLSQLTDQVPLVAVPLATGLNELFGALEPVLTPLNDALASAGGSESTDGGAERSEGPSVTAGLDMLASAVGDNAADTPLAPLGETVADVADAVGALGDVLANDSSALNPLTNPLGSVLGTSDADEFSGAPGTLADAGDGLVDLTSGELAPLAALTEPLDGGLNTLAEGVAGAGQQIVDATGADPSGVSGLIGEVLGGESAMTAAPSGDAGFSLDTLTGALPIGTDALPAELAGPLDPVLSQLG